MSQKCLHKGCGKTYTDPTEPCTYHSGPPVFHEGQKGWKCCKPRVLTFDEFLSIPPCTTGVHSAVDDTPAPEPKPAPSAKEANSTPAAPRKALEVREKGQAAQTAVPVEKKKEIEPETEDDDENVPIPSGATCRRRGCGQKHTNTSGDRSSEKCIYHPGAPLFHEGSKGYTCCKRRVLEFDQFLNLEGCQTKSKHLFVGSGGARQKATQTNGTSEGGSGETIDPTTIRTDFYQTPAMLCASLFLKQIDPSASTITFSDSQTVSLDLKTKDGRRYTEPLRLWGEIDTEKSKFSIKGTKLELELIKKEGSAWPALKEGEVGNGEIIQSGRAGRV